MRLARSNTAGFSLVEVTLALGIAVFCLVVVFGLLSVGVNTSSLSVEQTTATNLLSAVAGDLRTAANLPPKGSKTKTAIYGLEIPAPSVASAANPGATPTPLQMQQFYLDANGSEVSSAASARYQLSVVMTQGVGRAATVARVMISWPPIPVNTSTPAIINTASSVETLIALDRN